MGTTNSQYEEWLELYNGGSENVSLDGWKIAKGDGDTDLFGLSGEIQPGQYFLVCRTTPSVSNPLSGVCDATGAFSGGGINNTSESLYLEDGSQNIIDSIDAENGWPAGDSSTKKTMQWTGSSWVTAEPTPGAINSVENNNQNSGNNNDNDDENTSTTATLNKSDSTKDDPPLVGKIYSTMLLNLDVSNKAVAGSPVHFKAKVLDFDRSLVFKGHYVWNMGDGTVYDWAVGYKKTNDGFDHVYKYPGTYLVDVKYYNSLLQDIPAEIEKKFTVEVIDSALNISKVYPDGSIEIENVSKIDVDLSDWKLKDYYGNTFIFAEDSFIAKDKKIVVNSELTKLKPSFGAYLFTPTNTLVNSYAPVNKPENNFISKSSAKKKVTIPEIKEEKDLKEGLVLGAEEFRGEGGEVVNKKIHRKYSPTSNTWILIFIALIGVTTSAIFFLKKEKIENEEEYELIDE